MTEAEPTGGKLRTAFWLWVMLVVVGTVLVVTIAGMVAVRRNRRKGGGRKAKKGRRILDAWAEAGRRVEPIRLDEPPPEVLPEDRP